MDVYRKNRDLDVASTGMSNLGELLDKRDREELNGFLGICFGTGLSLLFWAGIYVIVRVI